MVVLLVKKALHPSLWIGLAALIIMAVVFLFRNTPPASPGNSQASTSQASEPAVHKININTADSSALGDIPGIGPSIAEAILAYRNENGPITDPGQLLNVSGIGKKKLILLLEYVYWEE